MAVTIMNFIFPGETDSKISERLDDGEMPLTREFMEHAYFHVPATSSTHVYKQSIVP